MQKTIDGFANLGYSLPQFNETATSEGWHQSAKGFVFGLHHHAVNRGSGKPDDLPGQGDLQRVAVAAQVAALAGVVGNAVARVEFQAARDTHGVYRS